MTSPFERLAAVDPLVHAPARLAILTALGACKEADFTYLRRITGLTQGNLGSHLTKLEDGGLVAITKSFVGRTPRTSVALTDDGQAAIRAWWDAIAETRSDADAWEPDGER
ncbi:MAG: transcriptional regulator [Actinomycetota bacterium]